MIDKDYILKKLEDILEDPDIKTRDKLAAIKMCGEYLKMFEQSKKVQIDIRGLIAQMSDGELRSFNHVRNPKLVSGSSTTLQPEERLPIEGVDGGHSELGTLPLDSVVRSGILIS
jgi:hypothetical protein